ncbi:DUF6493 family protein [Herbidospora sp. NBRC 101105]|uniref:DUF7824 domain-containing protein n=1 Tax=Herbidospora sp. NBRC 101105 TaxID=3032195 RepID=UPI0024A22619|nr:DUF6493 family protein [Herbidospora sp. NBRC 101105]GLX99351.1 hypothetical protein Hesp01_73010 [Herbidospora sp. NBRC 101105]
MSLLAEISHLLADRSITRLADRLVTLTEEERAELTGQLPGLVKKVRVPDEPLDATMLLLTGAGVITGPAAAVTWMTGRDVTRRWAAPIDVALVCRVAATRPPEWRRDVAVRLAQRIRRPGDRIAPLAVALLRESGAAPPEHDPLVAAWLSEPGVADDPLTPVLLPRVFDADGAGRALRDERLEPEPTHWLATAVRELPREQALDGCVSRFLRGGDPQDLRFFVRLHTLLDPTPAESAPRVRDYLRLLPSAPGPVAELAAAQVRRALPLDHADLVEAVEALTFRPEAKLAAVGLRWTDQTIRATPEHAGDFVTALTMAYAHTSFDVRNRAAELTMKHAGLFTAHAEAFLAAIPELPAGLAAALATRFGGEVPVEDLLERKEFPPLPEPPEPEPFPQPSIVPSGLDEWIRLERWLAAFVAGIHADRAELRRELTPYVEQQSYYRQADARRTSPDAWQTTLAAELVSPGSVPVLPPLGPERFWEGESYSTQVLAVTRGAEIAPPEQTYRGITVSFGHPERGHYLDDDAPVRSIDITWTSDEGPSTAEARENGERVPYRNGWVSLTGAPVDEAVARAAEMRWNRFHDDEERHADVGEAMPDFVLDGVYERMAELGVHPARIEAMRTGGPVPPPGDDEPCAAVTVTYFPARQRSFQPAPLPEAEEWRRQHLLPHPNMISPLHDFLLHRYAEILDALRADTLPPVLLATPTWLRGHLDPAVLVDRLESCAAAGREPLEADLAQALLRLPRGNHPAEAARAAAIGSAAARQVAAWLAGEGMPDPECGATWPQPAEGGERRLTPVLRAAPTGVRLIDEVALRQPFEWTDDEKGGAMGAWPTMVPSHREVVAVNFLPFTLRTYWSPCVGQREVSRMVAADGPLGDATATIVAYLLGAEPSRTIPLVLRMAARGDLPAETMGRRLALLIRNTWLETRPVVTALADLAEAGGHHEVWRMLRAMLPELLGEGRRITVPQAELVAFATDVARWTGARGEIPVIAEFAKSRRTIRFVHECKRLHAQLTGTCVPSTGAGSDPTGTTATS